MESERILAKINGRKMGAEIASLIAASDFKNPDYMLSLIESLTNAAGLNKPVEDKPKKLESLAALGTTQMPFGQHVGRSFDDVPLEYLDWLCRTQEDFYKSLRAYLTHPDLDSRRPHERD